MKVNTEKYMYIDKKRKFIIRDTEENSIKIIIDNKEDQEVDKNRMQV